MKKIFVIIIALSIIVLSLSACTSQTDVFVASDYEIAKSIMKVNSFADFPNNYSYFDYKAKAVSLDKLVFGFASNSQAVSPFYSPSDQATWNPLGFWEDQQRQPSVYNPLVTGYMKRSFGIPTYVADSRVVSSGAEALTTISMVLGASYAGIDKSNQQFGLDSYNFVEMTLKNYDTGSRLVKNVGAQGQSFWYDIFPQIMFARLYDMYASTPYMKEMVLNGADEWLEALPYFVKDGEACYEFVGYNVTLESPTVVGDHIEPPNGGLAFLFYSAYQISGEQKYLDGAMQVLDYLETYPKNPNYEAMTDYAPYVAAALNARCGTSYDVGKMLDYVFEGDSAFRAGWSVLSGDFGGYSVDGLVGQAGDYAFSMNSFHLASVLAPMVKYDSRYASAVGKYMLNLVNNAKVFFPQNLSLSQQSMNSYLAFDKDGSICYEGFRNNYNGVNGYAMGDATTMFGQPCDLSLYSSAFIGALGGIVSKTNVKGILRIDLNATDSYGVNDYSNYLYYNPYETNKTVKFNGGNGRYDLFDAVQKKVVARNVSGTVNINVPARSSRVIVVLPANSSYKLSGSSVTVNGIAIARYQAAVNISLTSRQELTSDSEIKLDYAAPTGDAVTNMKITFDGITVYDGAPIDTFRYDKSVLPDTDYTLRVTVTTQNGLTDTASKRVVAR